jgi:hypothetical protein
MNNTISKSVWVNVCIIVWDSVGNIVWDSVKYSAQTFTLADTSVVWWRIRSSVGDAVQDYFRQNDQ